MSVCMTDKEIDVDMKIKLCIHLPKYKCRLLNLKNCIGKNKVQRPKVLTVETTEFHQKELGCRGC